MFKEPFESYKMLIALLTLYIIIPFLLLFFTSFLIDYFLKYNKLFDYFSIIFQENIKNNIFSIIFIFFGFLNIWNFREYIFQIFIEDGFLAGILSGLYQLLILFTVYIITPLLLLFFITFLIDYFLDFNKPLNFIIDILSYFEVFWFLFVVGYWLAWQEREILLQIFSTQKIIIGDAPELGMKITDNLAKDTSKTRKKIDDIFKKFEED